MPEAFTSQDRPDEDGEKEYAVRLLFNVNANSPEHAAMRFIDQVNAYGLKAWVYRVVETQTLNQYMVHVSEETTYSLEEFERRMAGAGEYEDEPVEDVISDGRL